MWKKNQKEQLEKRKQKQNNSSLNKSIYKNPINKRVSGFTYPFIIAAIFISSFAIGQDSINAVSSSAYKNLLSLKLDNTDLLLDSSSLPFDTYIKHYSKAIRAIANDNKQLFDKFEDFHSQAYDIISEIDKSSPYRQFYLAELMLQSTIVHLKYEEEWNAVLDMRKAYSLINSNVEQFPEFLPNNKTLGLLHIIIGSVPSKYQWALSFLGFSGEVWQGVKELKQVANSGHMFNTEANIILAMANSYILQNVLEASNILQVYYEQDKNNLLFGYLYASILIKNSQSDLALNVINQALLLQTEEHIELPILGYLKAEILLQKGNYSSSISWYEHFIKKQHGESFIKDAYYKIAMNHLLLGNKDKVAEYLKLVQNNGNLSSDIDKYANKQSKSEVLPNPTILEMRYKLDGGYYENVEKIIDKVGDFNFATQKDQVEFNYRKARYYHKTNKISMAIALYKVTINAVSDEQWYFGPNSALQLGYIYKDLEDNESAAKYFKLAMEYKNHEYKYSIDNKAKSGLESLQTTISNE